MLPPERRANPEVSLNKYRIRLLLFFAKRLTRSFGRPI